MTSHNRCSMSGKLLLVIGLFLCSPGRHNLLVPAGLAQEQEPCENVVAEAEKLYDAGRFTPAISLLRLCLPKGVPEVQRVGAYRLLALAYLAEDKREEAQKAIKEIFGLKRDYACDLAQDSQPYCDLVAESKPPETFWYKMTGGWKRWLWYGGGLIGAGTAVYFSQQKTTEEQPLPEPPSLP